YYLQYPAVTILFYPPLFPAVEAVFYFIFGISEKTALLTVAVFYLFLAIGAWRLFSRWLDRWTAVAAAIFFIALPEIALWGRQVMLEIPASAALVWSIDLFLRWLDDARPRHLYAAALVLLAGLYIKQTIIF